MLELFSLLLAKLFPFLPSAALYKNTRFLYQRAASGSRQGVILRGLL